MRYARSKNLTPYDVLKIASMIEKETVVPAERRLVAAVIYNRLKQDIPLGIDATIRFAVGNYTKPLSDPELAIDSPYNTRLYGGLPPGPAFDFAFAADANRRERELLDDREPPRQLTMDEALDQARSGAVLLDTRSPESFASGHVRGSINVGLDGRFDEYAGDIRRPGRQGSERWGRYRGRRPCRWKARARRVRAARPAR